MSVTTEAERLAEIERTLAKLTGPKPVVLGWTDYKELVAARHELAREQRRQDKALRDAEMAAQLRREAPSRRRRAKEIAALEQQIAELEASAGAFREELRMLYASPLDTEDSSDDAAKRRKWPS